MQDARQSLDQQKQVATQGGMTAIDKAQLNDIQQQLANQNSAQQGAIQSQAAQQGLSNSGSKLAQQMLASQGNSTAAANQGASVAANAQARALQAMQNYGTQAGNLQQQQFNQGATTANAQNAINQFNAANRQATNLQNAAAQQQANSANFNMANTIGAKNTDIANQQAQLPTAAAQANFTNNLNRNTAAANALNAVGTNMVNQGNKQAGQTADTIGTIAKVGGSLWDAYNSYYSDERLKKDIKPADNDVETMMENLVGKKFKYKEGDQAEHISPMAQDIEKAGLPVLDTPKGKLVIDNDDTKGAVLAALGNLHARIKKLEH
jgi:hypothetical protein